MTENLYLSESTMDETKKPEQTEPDAYMEEEMKDDDLNLDVLDI